MITQIDSVSASVTYTPNPDFFGSDTFTYIVNDGTVDSSNIATVTITINPINDSPVAFDDFIITDEDTPLVIDVLANDTDVDGDTLIVTEESDNNSVTPVSFDSSWLNPLSFSLTTMFAEYVPAIENVFEGMFLTLVPSISAANDDVPSVTIDSMKSLESSSGVITYDDSFKKNKNEIKQTRAEIKQLKSERQDAKDDLKENKKELNQAQKALKKSAKNSLKKAKSQMMNWLICKLHTMLQKIF